MINFKKGTGHSLAQSDKIGKAKAAEGVVAGMLVELNTSGETVKVPVNPANDATYGNAKLLGFAINNQTDGDVIESGKIGFIQLDGNSVIETDQTDAAITAVNYPVGSPICAGATAGKVRLWTTANDGRVIGHVEGIRNLQSVVSTSQNYLDLSGATVTKTIPTQKLIPLLGIKLKS
jgi:hypothetical protein